ncbi:MAG: TrmB family transcriptional regulator [Thermoplasmata archaeon]
MYEALFELIKKFENADIEEFSEITGKAISTLINIGFTEKEARAYLYLYVSNYGTVEQIAEMAGIPRTSCYRILKRLEKRGMVRLISTEPRTYTATPPEIVGTALATRISSAFEKIEKFRFEMEDGKSQALQSISPEKFSEKLCNLIDITMKELIISVPEFSSIWKRAGKNIEKAIRRNLRIIVITRKMREIAGIEMRMDEKIRTTEIISDRKQMLFTRNWKNFYQSTQKEFIEHILWMLGLQEE